MFATIRSRHAVAAALIALACFATMADGTSPVSAASATKFPVTCVPRPAPIDHSGLRDVSETAHGRLRTYTMTSPAVGVTHVNVLLPARYDRASSQRYPVLYLLHGALGSYSDWASTATVAAAGGPQGGNVQALVGTLPLIVVMPDDSPNGSYADWYGISDKDAALRPVPRTPAWETYDIEELIPWVDSTFSTQPTAAGRAIAGLSSGGAGAAKYATTHPGLFGFVGLFSGALDNNLVDSTTNTYAQSDIFHSANPPDDRCKFGDPITSVADNAAYYWHDNDPTYEAGNLTGVKLFVTSGNGTPTAADAQTNAAVRAVQGAIEVAVDDMGHHFVAAVKKAGLGASITTDFYGNGVHSWHYWQRDLTSFLNWLRPQLGKSVASPSSFSYRTARVESAAWSWSFHHDSGLSVPNVNTAEEFVYLDHISPLGLNAAGHGTLRVTTPKGSYEPFSSHDVIVGRVTTTTKANRAGQLSFSIALGPSATHRQVDFPPSGQPADMHPVHVSISTTPRPKEPASQSWLVALSAGGAVALGLAVAWRVRVRAASR